MMRKIGTNGNKLEKKTLLGTYKFGLTMYMRHDRSKFSVHQLEQTNRPHVVLVNILLRSSI